MNNHAAIPAFKEDWVDEFTDRQLCGQRIMAGFEGAAFNEYLKFLIGNLNIGGIILFSRNIESPEQMKQLCGEAQAFAEECGQPPLFIAIDQEGGVVSRLKEPFTQFPEGNPGMKTTEDALHFATITANELKKVGVNMNMAPVMDVQPAGFDGIMNKRVFKGDAGFVSHMGSAVISGLQNNGVLAVAKHFPGIGRTTLDSHLTLPVLDADYDEFLGTDLEPFRASVHKQVAGIMLSHIQYNFIDPDWPASLSVAVVRNLLRNKLHYNGVVMTDDIDMKAISADIKTSVEKIVEADVDIALICRNSNDIESAFKTFDDIIKNDTGIKNDYITSVKRILKLKSENLV